MKLNTKWAAAVAVAAVVIGTSMLRSAKGENPQQPAHWAVILQGWLSANSVGVGSNSVVQYTGYYLLNSSSSSSAPHFDNPIYYGGYTTNTFSFTEALEVALNAGGRVVTSTIPAGGNSCEVLLIK